MTTAKALLVKLGLMHSDATDRFDMRLARIGRREQGLQAVSILFRNRQRRSEA